MADSTKNISVIVQATQADRALIRTAGNFDNLNHATQQGEKLLAMYQREMDKAAGVIIRASKAMGDLKRAQKELQKENTALNNTVKQQAARLATNAKQQVKNREIIKNQEGVIRNLVKEIQRLAGAQDQLATSTNKATAAGSKQANQSKPLSRQEFSAQETRRYAAEYQRQVAMQEKARAQELAGMRKHMQSTWAVADSSKKAASGTNEVKDAVNSLHDNVQWNALRYQMYDVANTFRIVGDTALTAGLAIIKTGVAWDKDFANVIRTSQVTGTAVEWLKEEFLELQTLIPVTASDLAEIGTLGAQMGVAASELAHFTEITAKFSAAAGLGVEESATALSRLDELLPDVQGNYERLGSTILRTGVNAVATEAQIVRGTNQIASMGEMAGLTTPEIVALASAMSSLGFSPELQRSVVTSSFSRIMTATSQVTEQTEKFGAVLGMTGRQFQAAWQSDAIGTYETFLRELAKRSDAVTVLQDLRLASQRLTPNLLKLGQNTRVLDDALADTRDEWEKNTEMQRQYDISAGTVSARIQVMTQTWESLLVTLDGSADILKPIISGFTSFLRMLRELAKKPGVAAIATIGTGLIALTGIVALATAGLAGLAAGYIAIINAQAGLNALRAQDTASLAVNTGANLQNSAARGGNTAAVVGNSAALAQNTAAHNVNGIAVSGSGMKLLGFSSKIISAMPAILSWTSAIGAAAVAAVTLSTGISELPNLLYDLRRNAAVDEDDPFEVFKFDASVIEENTKAIVEYEKRRSDMEASVRAAQASGNVVGAEADALGQAYAKILEEGELLGYAADDVERAWGSIERTMLELDPNQQVEFLRVVRKEFGMTTDEVLEKLPGLGSVLRQTLPLMEQEAEVAERAATAHREWALSLDLLDVELNALQDSLGSAANGFINLSGALSDAYDGDRKNGEGFASFRKNLTKSISDFEGFYEDLGVLVRRGGGNLATLFAEQGPEARQALTDALALGDGDIAKIEDQMRLAAFYASEEFANTFSQNNAILSKVWAQTGSNEAVAAVNAAIGGALRNQAIDPQVLADLGKKYGFDIPVNMVTTFDSTAYENAKIVAEAEITPIKVTLEATVLEPDGLIQSNVERMVDEVVDRWIVELDGEFITLDVDPNTVAGAAKVAEWVNQEESSTEVELPVGVEFTDAKTMLDAFIAGYINQTYYLHFRASTVGPIPRSPGGRSNIPGSATGSLAHSGKLHYNNYPKFARGTIVRGPGSGTSDSILARISNGEAITRARAVRFYGTKMMEDINNMRFPRFATGFTPQGYGGASSPERVVNVSVVQNNPVTRDPLVQLREDAEMIAEGIW